MQNDPQADADLAEIEAIIAQAATSGADDPNRWVGTMADIEGAILRDAR